jgi:D-alanine-D-alanine ligase
MTDKTSKHVAVLMGGWSSEREVSLVSGTNCATALEDAGYRVTQIDVQRDLRKLLNALEPQPDVVFNALHGRFGEDGTFQAVLNLLGIPYTHSGLLASALAMNKPVAKQLFAAAGIPCPEGQVVDLDELRSEPALPPPYVIKPLNEGSSVGVHIVHTGDNHLPLDDWVFGDKVLLERYIPGRELTVAVVDGNALGVTELRPRNGFYSYKAKYSEGETEHLCPAPIPAATEQKAKDYATRAHNLLGCRGVSRADFRYDDTGDDHGNLYLLEINTQPGMTPLSLVPEQAAQCGQSFSELVALMVEAAACDA